MRISDWSSDVCSSDLGGEADEGEIDHHEENGPGFDVDDEGNPIAEAQPRRTFLPSSFTGSVRHLRKLAANALALVSARGKPTVFITLTCNPHWPEILRELLVGQTTFEDRKRVG